MELSVAGPVAAGVSAAGQPAPVAALLVALLVGAAVGAVTRVLLGRLRRGAVLPAGPLEALSGALAAGGVAVAWASPRLAVVLTVGVLLVALGPLDALHHRLPDALTRPAVAVAAVVVTVLAAVAPGSGSLLAALVTGVLWWVGFAGLHRISPRSMGRGDVKLVPSLGLLTGYLGAAVALTGLVLAFLLGAVVAVVGLALRRLRPASAIPFGPFLLLGAWVSAAFSGLPALLLSG